MALQALIQLIRPFAVRMSVTKALNTAVGPDVSEFAVALVRLNALAPHATCHQNRKNDIKQRPNFHVWRSIQGVLRKINSNNASIGRNFAKAMSKCIKDDINE